MIQKLKPYRLPILSGFLLGTSYIPFPPWTLLFGIIPLWLFWAKESSYKKVFIAGWLTQFVFNPFGFHWVSYTVVEFGRLPWPVGLLALLAFSALAHLHYPIAGVLWKWICKKTQISETTSLLILPLVFTLCERLYPFLFNWHFGYLWLWAKLPGYQLAEWIGFFGINVITLFINALFALFWLRRKPKQWVHKYSIAAVVLFVMVNLLGFIQSLNIEKPDKTLKVTLVQGNIGNLDKIYAQEGRGYIDKISDTYIRLTEEALKENPDTDLVIWPETAFPENIYSYKHLGKNRRRLAVLTQQHDFTLLTGAYQKDLKTQKTYNGMIVMKGPVISDSYQKTHLLAFGEYLPFAEYYPPLKKMLPMVSDFGRGKGPSVLNYEKAKIGAQICYEGLFDDFSTNLKKKGAQLIVNLTNDSWFGYPSEPYQHMYVTLARAIENRIPLIRVTNTGISTAVLHDGTILPFSPRNEEWHKTFEIPIASTPPRTFYVRLSENWPWILILLIGFFIAGDKFARTGKH